MNPPGPSSAETELQLGRLAVQLGLLSADQLEEVLHPSDATLAKMALGARLLMSGVLDEDGLNRLIEEYERRNPATGVADLIGAPVARAQGNEDATIINLDAGAVRAAAFALADAPAPARPASSPPPPAPPGRPRSGTPPSTLPPPNAPRVGSASGMLPPAPPPRAPARPASASEDLEGRETMETPRQPGRPAPPPPPPQPATRRVIEERFEILDQLGRGGMGVVYKARDLRNGSVVALKMLINKEALESSYKRFVREAKAIMKLDHPNVVQVYHLGECDGNPYYAMEYVEGRSFGDLIEAGTLPLEQVARIGRDVALALAEAHANGIIHRDIKPDNVLVTKDGVPKVADFGLAKDKAAQTALTMGGNALGTPIYMPPEQATGQLDDVDRRSDVYSLGATLYEAATGKAPFRGDDPFKIMENVVHQPLTPPSRHRKGLGDLEKIIVKSMAKNKKHRYPDMQAMADDLTRYLDGEPIQGKPVKGATAAAGGGLWLWVVVGTVIAFLIGAAFAFMGKAGAEEPPQAKAAKLAKDARQELHGAETERMLGKRDAMQAGLREALETAQQALALDSAQAEAAAVVGLARRRLALFAGKEEDFVEAGVALDRALGLNSGDAELQLERGLAYWFLFVRWTRPAWPLLSDPNVAFPAAQPRLERKPEDVEKYRRLAAADLEALAQGKDEVLARAAHAFLLAMTAEPSQVLLAAEEALKNKLYRPELLRVRGRARMDLGTEEAANYAVVDYNSYLNLSPGEAGVWAERGIAQFRSGHHAEAVDDFARAEKEGAPAAEMAWNRTVCRVAGNQDAEALKEFAALLGPATQDAHRWTSRALLHARAERWPEAREDLTRAHNLAPTNEIVGVLLGEWQQALGDPRAALKTLNAILEAKPKCHEAWVARGRVREDLNELAAGIEDFTQALALKPDDVPVLLERASYQGKRGAWDKAAADLGRAMEIDPKNPKPYVQRGRNAAKNGKFADAVADFDRALALEPNRAKVLVYRGSALFEDGKFDKAFDSYTDAVIADATYVDAWLVRGTAALKRYEALAATPADAKKWLDKGLADLRKAAELDPDGDDGKKARKLIAKYEKK